MFRYLKHVKISPALGSMATWVMFEAELCCQPFTYTKNADGELIIVEDEAAVVRRIYANFLAGRTPSQIAADLTNDDIPTPRGKRVWPLSTINSILRNEKYKGDALIQKTFTVDFLTKKVKKNEGEVPQ